MFRCDGKKVLLTGASGGIGQEIAQAFVQQGAHIVLSGTRQDVLEGLAGRLKTMAPEAIIEPCVCALDDRDAVGDLVKNASTLMGGLDILVNNAGITKDTLAMRMKDDHWDQVMEINLRAAFVLSRHAIKGMMRKRWGRIIFMSSVVATMGNPGQCNYAASKAGMIGMAKSLAREVASRGITVNSVTPGFIQTEMLGDLFSTEETKKRLQEMIPLARTGQPKEVAGAVVYLASDVASYVTGSVINVSGGLVM